MNREILAKYVGKKNRRRNILPAAWLGLVLAVCYPDEPALRAVEYTSDAVTQVCVLIGPAPVFHPLRGWSEMPQPNPPRGFVKLPLACNAGSRALRTWLCYKRGPVEETPLVTVQVAAAGTLEGSRLEKIPVLLSQDVTKPPVHLCFERAFQRDEPIITDLLIRTKREWVCGYEYGGQIRSDSGGSTPVYLYYKLQDAASVQGPPFAQGIRPEMLNAPDTEYEIARAQIDNDHLLVRLQKLEVRHATVASGMPFRRTEVIKLGMSRQEMNQVTRSLNGGLNGDYAGLKACVGLTLGWTSSTTYAASEETTLTEEVKLAAIEHDRYYAFATVLDILRIQEIDTGKVIREAVSHSDNIGYFVTDKYGSWRSAPE
jgi:hypothetical protein